MEDMDVDAEQQQQQQQQPEPSHKGKSKAVAQRKRFEVKKVHIIPIMMSCTAEWYIYSGMR